MKTHTIIPLVITTFMSFSAMADTITVSQGYNFDDRHGASIYLGDTTYNPNNTIEYFGLQIPTFDATLGELTGVNLVLNGTVYDDWGMSAQGVNHVSSTGTTYLNLEIFDNNGIPQHSLFSYQLSANVQTNCTAGTPGYSVGCFNKLPSGNSQSFAQSFNLLDWGYGLSDFTDGSLFNLIARSNMVSTVTSCVGGGNEICRVSRDFDVYATAALEFTYTPAPLAAVPVPAAVWLFGSGLIGLIGVARRKKA